MARESQGLQVLLIVFVMLTVVLGVTTYLYSKRADEATKAAAAASASEKQAQQATADKQTECNRLKIMVGYPDQSIEDINKHFAEEMDTYGNTKKPDNDNVKIFDPSTLYYSRLLDSMHKTILARDQELIQLKGALAALQLDFKNREGAKDDAIKAFTADYSKVKEQVAKITADYKTGLDATAAESARNAAEVMRIKSNMTQEVTKADRVAKDSRQAVAVKEAEVAKLLEEKRKKDKQIMDVPSGEINWVSLPSKEVWINRGRADFLQKGTQFGVYSAESSDSAKAVPKGKVEVTVIDGDHSARCKIIEDKLADPIMAGDKVFTPLWSPGQQNHFALTGIMDLDGDGHNQLGVVRGLILQNGGAVDCWLDEQGHKQGQITADTGFLVEGGSPDKSTPEFKNNHGAILHDAERYHLHTMKLNEFKQQMGYQKSSSVEHFGGASRTASDVSRAAMAAKAAPKPAKAAAAKSGDGEN
jgi:hypothetical protein